MYEHIKVKDIKREAARFGLDMVMQKPSMCMGCVLHGVSQDDIWCSTKLAGYICNYESFVEPKPGTADIEGFKAFIKMLETHS